MTLPTFSTWAHTAHSPPSVTRALHSSSTLLSARSSLCPLTRTSHSHTLTLSGCSSSRASEQMMCTAARLLTDSISHSCSAMVPRGIDLQLRLLAPFTHSRLFWTDCNIRKPLISTLCIFVEQKFRWYFINIQFISHDTELEYDSPTSSLEGYEIQQGLFWMSGVWRQHTCPLLYYKCGTHRARWTRCARVLYVSACVGTQGCVDAPVASAAHILRWETGDGHREEDRAEWCSEGEKNHTLTRSYLEREHRTCSNGIERSRIVVSAVSARPGITKRTVT